MLLFQVSQLWGNTAQFSSEQRNLLTSLSARLNEQIVSQVQLIICCSRDVEINQGVMH